MKETFAWFVTWGTMLLALPVLVILYPWSDAIWDVESMYFSAFLGFLFWLALISVGSWFIS